MADTRLSDLASASALSASDLFYVVQSAGSGGEKATGTQLLTLVGTTYVAKSGDTMTGALNVSFIAGNDFNAGTPALKFVPTSGTAPGFDLPSAGNEIWVKMGAASVMSFHNSGLELASGKQISWSNSSTHPSTTQDVILVRDAAGVLAQRNGTNAQTLRVYGTYTDSSNYERLSLSTTAGTSVNILAETLGTGGDNLDIVLTPAGTGSVKIPVAGLALSGVNANFLLGTTGTSRLTFAGTLSVINKSASADLYFGESTDTGAYFFRGTGGVNVTGAFQVTEMTAPSAPATNSVRIYAEDNGSGKTRLMALFATGAAQQIAIEP